jgi:hypothetical protein
VVVLCFVAARLFASDTDSSVPKFLGAQSCSSSSCHGGAGNNKDQFTIWSKRDFHYERPVALLETRRSAVIAENLKIADPTRNERCTVCHAPFRTVPSQRLSAEANAIEGVSCETCHAPAENWLRAHTRTDWTTADRVCAGMRDLRNLYVRANTCVACHQNVDFDLRRAGHPELTFELDGQAVTEPKHWRKSEDKPGPQIWLVGQAVALREISWQLARDTNSDASLRNQWEGLLWVLQRLPSFTLQDRDLDHVQKWSDQFARSSADLVWSDAQTRQCLDSLADTSDTFADTRVPRQVQARRAERLVLALDRLSSNPKLNQPLNALFADVQSLPDFDPNQFAKHLSEFHTILGNVSN